MASISQGLVLTTTLVLSTTVLYLTFCKQKYSSPFQNPTSSNQHILRSCLYSEEKKREKRGKKKRVKFSENVMVKEEKSDENREKEGKKKRESNNSKCRNEMPPNRIALYNGILRDRVQRMGCCN